jgi:hypothetical protein
MSAANMRTPSACPQTRVAIHSIHTGPDRYSDALQRFADRRCAGSPITNVKGPTLRRFSDHYQLGTCCITTSFHCRNDATEQSPLRAVSAADIQNQRAAHLGESAQMGYHQVVPLGTTASRDADQSRHTPQLSSDDYAVACDDVAKRCPRAGLKRSHVSAPISWSGYRVVCWHGRSSAPGASGAVDSTVGPHSIRRSSAPLTWILRGCSKITVQQRFLSCRTTQTLS